MPGAVERIVRSGAAYQAAAFVSAGLSFFTFAAYNRAIGQYRLAEADLILAWLIFLAIGARLGFGEALLRHWFTATDEERPRLQRTIQLAVLGSSLTFALVVTAFAGPVSAQLKLIHDPWVVRYAAFGLFFYCNLDIAQTLLRARDDRRTYLIATMSNVFLTITLSVLLIIVLDQGVRGYLVGNYGATAVIVLWLWSREAPVLLGRTAAEPAFVDPERSRVDVPAPHGPDEAAEADGLPEQAFATAHGTPAETLDPGRDEVESAEQRRAASRGDLRALLRFGLPTVPADAAVFGFNLLDRTLLRALDNGVGVRQGYALAVFAGASKIASGVILMARAFQLAFPPLAYGIKDPAAASRVYASAVRGYVVVLGGTVVGVALCAPWTVQLLIGLEAGRVDPRPGTVQVLPLLAAAWAMWGVVPVMTTIAGRLGATRLTVPASLAGLAVNLVALLLLVPPYGAHGAAAALVIAYVALLTALNLLTRRHFPVAFDLPRIGAALAICAAACLLAGPITGDDTLGWGPAGVRLLMFCAVIAGLFRFGLEPQEQHELVAFLRRVRLLPGR